MPSLVTTCVFTAFALTAFAANTILCRLALGQHSIDAASFTVIRLASGILALWLIVALRGAHRHAHKQGSWLGASMLFLYAICFSYAYLTLETGTGALILFGAVQLTMILVSLYRGETLHATEWSGVTLAFVGFVYLVLPGVAAPSLMGFALMTLAGIAWGVYTLVGKGSKQPLLDTTANFTRTLPLLAIPVLFMLQHTQVTAHGALLAMVSGAIASGMGYAIWYRALTGLSGTQAAVLQLAVPVIAACGGIVFMAEQVSVRLILSGLLILGGIGMVIAGRSWYLRHARRI